MAMGYSAQYDINLLEYETAFRDAVGSRFGDSTIDERLASQWIQSPLKAINGFVRDE